MTITIRLKTDNAAFNDNLRAPQIASIVSHVAALLLQGKVAAGRLEAKPLYDANGNRVGSVTVTGR